jgi:DNA-binding transcriptional MerR regulator
MAMGYRIHEFASLAGVTVKTLHHYDRVGLLKPRRTASRYRVYAGPDLERLRQILALRFLGLPLRRIRELLAPGAPPLHLALRQQRQLLEEKRRLIDRAIGALATAERGLEATPGDKSGTLQTLITVIGMQDSIDEMRKYYSDEAWASWRHHYEDWPSADWQALYRDINAALDADPQLPATSETAQALGARWLALDRGTTTVASIRTGLRKAWADRDHWPQALKERLATHKADRATRFINEALWERWEAERLAREGASPTPTAPARVSESRRRLYHDCAAALPLDPASPEAQMFVARWRAVLDAETGGDSETAAEMIRSWRSRRAWPPAMTRYTASCYDMDADSWRRVADFIEAAHNHCAGVTG